MMLRPFLNDHVVLGSLALAVAGGVFAGVNIQPWLVGVVERTRAASDLRQAVPAAEVP